MSHAKPTLTDLIAALSSCTDPLTELPFAHARTAALESDTLTIALGYPCGDRHSEIQQQLQTALRNAGHHHISIQLQQSIHRHAVRLGTQAIANVKNVIAVASGKGGVGKSTVTANIALALHTEGASVGILDADIYGPSQPHLLGIADAGKPALADEKTMRPHTAHGLQVNSIGFLVSEEQSLAWRGPMATQALQQICFQTAWGTPQQPLDYLLLDLPPGTGDIQLTLCQKIPVAGAIIVTTPQDIALLDARKGISLFEKVGIPILGLVENMATHTCRQCGHTEAIFGTGGGKNLAEQIGSTWLGALPLHIDIRTQSDAGVPIVAAQPECHASRQYRHIAQHATARLSTLARDYSSKMPGITVL